MKIVWTSKSIISYSRIVSYLFSEWGQTSAYNFIDDVDKVLMLISKNPKMFKRSEKYTNIRMGILSPYNMLIYRVKNKTIELIVFWDNRQDSKKLKF